MGKHQLCTHPGRYHVGSDGLTIIRPHPQARTCFAREQGYVVARIEPAYPELVAVILASLNKIDTDDVPVKLAKEIEKQAERGAQYSLDRIARIRRGES